MCGRKQFCDNCVKEKRKESFKKWNKSSGAKRARKKFNKTPNGKASNKKYKRKYINKHPEIYADKIIDQVNYLEDYRDGIESL